MNFSEEFLYSNFEKCYREGMLAKEKGDLSVAKDKFYSASEFMGKLAVLSSGDLKTERLFRAKKLKDIADAISNDAKIQSQLQGVNKSTGNSDGMEEFFSFYSADKLTEGFDDVIGLQEAKNAIIEYLINPILYPEAYNYVFLGSKAVLLEGPPGTGKTTFAKAVAKEVGQPFALINVANLINCYVGETSKNIDKVFAYLRNYAEKYNCGITIFFDELDEIAKKRGGEDKASETAVPALLRNLDGVKENKAFLILANTNRKDVLDRALLERFRKQIYIPLPNSEMRESLFRKKLSEIEKEFFEQLEIADAVKLSDGLSGRDITFICDDLKYVLSEIKAGITKDVDLKEKFNQMIVNRQNEKQIVKT